MKEVLFTLLAFVGFSSVFADDYDYPYLTIVTSGGTVKSVAASSLVLTISDGQLVAVNDNGNQTFALTALSKMYFSKTDETATGSQVANGLAFSASEATATLGEDFTEPTLTNPYKLTLTWTSSDEDVATVDEDGEVTLVAAGSTTITASYAGSDDYVAGEVSYTLTVEIADAILDLFAGSEVDVYSLSGSHIGRFASIAQARAQLKRGLYIVRSNHKSLKLSIK